MACIDEQGKDNHVIVMHIEPSMEVHANQADEVFMRIGDKSKKLSFEDRMSLMYDKGERFFEDKEFTNIHWTFLCILKFRTCPKYTLIIFQISSTILL